jgi:hypothetical protein
MFVNSDDGAKKVPQPLPRVYVLHDAKPWPSEHVFAGTSANRLFPATKIGDVGTTDASGGYELPIFYDSPRRSQQLWVLSETPPTVRVSRLG